MLEARGTCVIVRIDREDQTKGGVFLPEQRSESGPVAGVVVSVGPGDRSADEPTRTIPPHNLEVGMRVLCNRHGGSYLERGGKRFLLCDEKAVLAIEREDVPTT